MNAQLMIQPSSFIDAGIQIKPVRGLFLFKLSEDLQERLQSLNEKQRKSKLSPDEGVELTGILELDRIFTLLNAKIIAESALNSCVSHRETASRRCVQPLYCHRYKSPHGRRPPTRDRTPDSDKTHYCHRLAGGRIATFVVRQAKSTTASQTSLEIK